MDQPSEIAVIVVLVLVLGMSMLIYVVSTRQVISELKTKLMFITASNDKFIAAAKKLIPDKIPLTNIELRRRKKQIDDRMDELDV